MSMSKVQACISCISGSLIGHLSLQGGVFILLRSNYDSLSHSVSDRNN
jgi:hypothetical protein